MKILLVGSGGREHAIAWKLAQNKNVSKIFVAPGNGGTALENKCENINITDLNELVEFAKENNIMYFLSGGSCLGAVRHQDFIPWDDDIDVCMLRKDYDKLIALVKDNRYLDTERKYKFLLPLDDNYIYPYMKLVDDSTIVFEKDIKRQYATGVWMDIFPMDIWPDEKETLRKIMKKHRFYKMMNKIYVAGNLTTMKKSILNIIGKGAYKILFRNKDYKYWNKKVIDMVTPCEGTYVGDRIWPVEDKEFFSKEVFSEAKYVKFRDGMFPIPVGYEEYLSKMYGDYMKLPKEEDRVFHDFEGYIK